MKLKWINTMTNAMINNGEQAQDIIIRKGSDE